MAGAQQPNQSDNSMALLWILAAVFVFGGIIWVVFKKQIIGFYFTIKLWEINLVSLFTDSLSNVKSYIIGADPNTMTFQDIVKVGEAVGSYIRYPIVFLICLFALIIFLASSTRVFKKAYNMKD